MSNEKLNDVYHGISNVDLVQIWLLSSDFALGKFFKYSLSLDNLKIIKFTPELSICRYSTEQMISETPTH